MSTNPSLTNNFKTWDVKLIWSVTYPSTLYDPGDVDEESFEIYGVDRGSMSISRPLTRINSLEQYNQGFQDGIPDIRVTIFTKESGPTFEKMRRLSATKIHFDVSLTLASDLIDTNLENNPHEGIWIDGYEQFLGCRVTSERTSYAQAEFPLREFECMVLRHKIMDSNTLSTLYPDEITSEFDEMIEGDGTYASDIPTK